MSAAERPIVIIGAGIAGLSAALSAAPTPVLLVDRGNAGGHSASILAQGGIAAATAANDCPEQHCADSRAVGAGHCNETLLRWLCHDAAASLDWLTAQGVRFDHDSAGHLALAREGGHQRARVVHAGGDATGARVHATLHARARQAGHVQYREGVTTTALQVSGDTVCGIRLRNAAGHCEDLPARAVVLATGGIGGLFSHSSTPRSADGSGLALALAAGAGTRDLELIQFHPTALDVAGAERAPLITEALRGAGARLLDANGAPLMIGQHPLGDLAPRDVVARAVFAAHRRDGCVWLDARTIAGNFAQTFPSVLAICQAHAIDPREQLIPVRAAVHFHMGGIASDDDGRTTLNRLYAVGEAAGNGVHGGNRLASNSLLECVAIGRRLGAQLSTRRHRPALTATTSSHPDPGYEAEEPALTRLRTLLWEVLGPVRRLPDLAAARDQLSLTPGLHGSRQGRVAHSLLNAALARPHSLGAHYLLGASQ